MVESIKNLRDNEEKALEFLQRNSFNEFIYDV